MENLEVTINPTSLKLNIPEENLNFHHLEGTIFDLTRKIDPSLLGTRLSAIIKQLEVQKIWKEIEETIVKNLRKMHSCA